MSMPAWAPIVMKMNFVVVPSGTDPEGSTTKAIFVVIFLHTSTELDCKKDSCRMTFTTFYFRRILIEKDGIIVNFVVVSNETEFGHILFGESENDAIIIINPKAPNASGFGIKLFRLKDWIEWILLEQFGLLCCLALNLLFKCFEKFIECFGGNNLHHSPMSSKRLFLLVIRPA
jgi:hypothetical protein